MRFVRLILTFIVLLAGYASAAEPTFADLAVLVAKGYFKKDVSQDASLQQCVIFLNRHGITFSLFDLVDPHKTVTKEDVARVVGQSNLLFSGEANVVNGSIKKPLEGKTWVDYCLLNDIDLNPIWTGILKRTEEGSLPEVRSFFGR